MFGSLYLCMRGPSLLLAYLSPVSMMVSPGHMVFPLHLVSSKTLSYPRAVVARFPVPELFASDVSFSYPLLALEDDLSHTPPSLLSSVLSVHLRVSYAAWIQGAIGSLNILGSFSAFFETFLVTRSDGTVECCHVNVSSVCDVLGTLLDYVCSVHIL